MTTNNEILPYVPPAKQPEVMIYYMDLNNQMYGFDSNAVVPIAGLVQVPQFYTIEQFPHLKVVNGAVVLVTPPPAITP